MRLSIYLFFQYCVIPTLTVRTRKQKQFVKRLQNLEKRLALSHLAVLAKRIVGRDNIAMGKMFARMVKFAKIVQFF